MAIGKYVVKVGDQFVADSGRLVSEYPDAALVQEWRPAMRLLAKALRVTPGATVEVFRDYGLASEERWTHDALGESSRPH